MIKNESIKTLKEIGEIVEDKKLLEKAKKLKTIPSDSNEFTKVCKYKDTSFLMDFAKQDEMLKVFLTEKEIDNAKDKDISLLASFAYEWVYGFEDIDGNFKSTANTNGINFEFTRKDAREMINNNDEKVFSILGLDREVLSEWERDLVMKQVITTIYDPMRTTMGLVLKRF
jgi:hypothetical protein